MNFKGWMFCLLISLTLFSSEVVAKFTPEQVKAVYIYRIASFVFWNSDEKMNDINICAPDDKEVKKILIDITKDKEIRDKPLRIVDTECDVIYITKEASLNLIEQGHQHTLSISDMTHFTELGGVVELTTLDGRIKPRVNLNNIGEYTLSASFLRVAEIVGGDK